MKHTKNCVDEKERALWGNPLVLPRACVWSTVHLKLATRFLKCFTPMPRRNTNVFCDIGLPCCIWAVYPFARSASLCWPLPVDSVSVDTIVLIVEHAANCPRIALPSSLTCKQCVVSLTCVAGAFRNGKLRRITKFSQEVVKNYC